MGIRGLARTPLPVFQYPMEMKNLVSLRLFSFILFCFVALGPKSTAMVMAGRSVHLTTLFPGHVNQYA